MPKRLARNWVELALRRGVKLAESVASLYSMYIKKEQNKGNKMFEIKVTYYDRRIETIEVPLDQVKTVISGLNLDNVEKIDITAF